jgi:hypothetical protein
MMNLALEINTQDISMCLLHVLCMVWNMQRLTRGPSGLQNTLTQINNINQRPMNHIMD